MRAAVVTTLDGPSSIEVHEVGDPEVPAGHVLIDVHCAGVVFPDVLHTRGEYQLRPALPFVPGWEVAGVVAVDGGGFAAGDRVAAMPVIGGFAEQVAVDPAMVFPLPDGVDFLRGAALPLNYLTAHLALVRRGQLTRGETVLVHGAAGGLGTAVCSLARALGAQVIGVASSAAKGDVARRAGAAEVVLADGFKQAALGLTDGRGVDMVVDPVGGDRFTDSLRALAPEGRLLVLGFAAREVPTVRTNRLLLTNTSVVGVASNELWSVYPGLPARAWQELMPLVESGAVDPVLDGVYPLEQAREAIEVLDQRRAHGKVLLTLR